MPEDTLLYQLVRDNLEEFLALTREKGRGLPLYVEDEFREYLRCGVLQYGFSRIRCNDCGDEHLLPFSCKKRGFCPSCCGRRMAEQMIHLSDEVFPTVPVRQWVVTIPPPLRYIVSTNRRLQQYVHRVIIQEISGFYTNNAGGKAITAPKPGSITFIQRFGSALNLNWHLHILFADGIWFRNGKSKVTFRKIPPPAWSDTRQVLTRITRRIIHQLEKRGIVTPQQLWIKPQTEPLLEEHPAFASAKEASAGYFSAFGERAGRPVRFIGKGYGYEGEAPKVKSDQNMTLNGFSLHCATRVKANDRKGLERLIMYVARPPLSTNRLSLTADGNVLYEFKRPFSDGRTHVLFSPVEFLEKLAALVPLPWFNQVKYNGVFAPNSPFRKEVVPAPEQETPGSGDEEDESPEKVGNNKYLWAILLKRVFNIDMKKCSLCGGSMRFISVIRDRGVIRRILEHLEIPTTPPDEKVRGPPEALDLTYHDMNESYL